jgi:hypothetical protein
MVADLQGKPVSGAVVRGRYSSSQATRWFFDQTTDDKGRFRIERSLDPLVLHALAPGGSLGGVKRVDVEASGTKVVIGPLATAIGRLKGSDGKALGDRELTYGIRVYDGEPGNSPFSDNFGGLVKTDTQGQFVLTNLVPGELYHLNLTLTERSSRGVTELTPKGPGTLDLGEIVADPNEAKPYVPPTPAKRAADAFAAGQKTSPREQIDHMVVEASREHTRPLLLLGRREDPACIELFRLFYEEPGEPRASNKEKGAPKPPLLTPRELRWEFELAALDADQPRVKAFAEEHRADLTNAGPPALAALNSDGSITSAYPLRLDPSGKLESRPLSEFLSRLKQPTRNAERILAEALHKAKGENKRVFLIMSASWCGPCRLLARFLAAHKGSLEPHYVFVRLDISRDEHIDPVSEHHKGSWDGSIPWIAILDGDGKAIVVSNKPARQPGYPAQNFGFPSDPASIDLFLGMIKQTAPRMSEETLDSLHVALSKKP